MPDSSQYISRTATADTFAWRTDRPARILRRPRPRAGKPHEESGYADILGPFIADMEEAAKKHHTMALEGMKESMERTIGHLGYKYFTYHIAHAMGIQATADRLPHILSTYPKPWVRHYFSEGYLNDDPVVSELLQRSDPFVWSEIALPDDLSRRQKRLFDEARDAGIANGITIPIRGQKSEIAALRACS
ncbi:autoinducer binding domain-containing protein [Telmatospirillum sp.]|uniref:autoinducer binding domain-containing protein n=1 Tax=Telmatospirillum sp. TaxID=2079197 RepID=UPI0028440B92|nr:autoinducer binding domain-containing protein [Telmatospirillum sp.]MDR3440143.1 autoinducer binding domain-containing protein [Telmatospirillum sp.]